jgi:hypothetical protein
MGHLRNVNLTKHIAGEPTALLEIEAMSVPLIEDEAMLGMRCSVD